MRQGISFHCSDAGVARSVLAGAFVSLAFAAASSAQAQTVSVGPTALSDGTNGTAYAAAVSAAGGTGPYRCTVSSGALPSGLALVGNQIGGTPTTAGSSSFTITCTDSLEVSGSQAYTLTIAPGAVLALGPQNLPAPTQGVGYAATLAASGGTGAGYSYAISWGSLPRGLAMNPSTGAISGTTLAEGSYAFTIRATDAQGNWGTRTFGLAIAERADPATDGEVLALSDGQFRAASRLAEGQIGNVMRHAEGLHNGMRCAVSNTLSVQAASPDGAASAANPGEQPEGRPVAVSCGNSDAPIALWASGTIGRDSDGSGQFRSDALTMGIDAQLAPQMFVGGALGLGWGEARFGSKGTLSDNTARTAMAYGSIGSGTGWFLDLVAGKSWLETDGSRFVNGDESIAGFDREGGMAFGAVALSYERPVGPVLVSGQARYDRLRIDLDGYRETSSSAYALTYGAASQLVQVMSIGVRGETTFTFDWGRVVPTGRVEYRHRAVGAYDQTIAYSNMLSREYVLRREGAESNAMSLSLGARVLLGETELGAEYGTSGTALDSFSGSELRVRVRRSF